MLPAPIAPDHNMGKQLLYSRLHADGEAGQSIDFKHRKCEFSITTKVRAANCCRVCACVSSRTDTQIDIIDTHADTDNSSKTPVCTNSSALAALDPAFCALCHHVAEFL